MMQAVTTQGARWVPARAASSFPLWCKGDKRSRGVPRHQAKVAISVQQDQDQEDCKTEVIVEPKPALPPESLAGEGQPSAPTIAGNHDPLCMQGLVQSA